MSEHTRFKSILLIVIAALSLVVIVVSSCVMAAHQFHFLKELAVMISYKTALATLITSIALLTIPIFCYCRRSPVPSSSVLNPGMQSIHFETALSVNESQTALIAHPINPWSGNQIATTPFYPMDTTSNNRPQLLHDQIVPPLQAFYTTPSIDLNPSYTMPSAVESVSTGEQNPSNSQTPTMTHLAPLVEVTPSIEEIINDTSSWNPPVYDGPHEYSMAYFIISTHEGLSVVVREELALSHFSQVAFTTLDMAEKNTHEKMIYCLLWRSHSSSEIQTKYFDSASYRNDYIRRHLADHIPYGALRASIGAIPEQYSAGPPLYRTKHLKNMIANTKSVYYCLFSQEQWGGRTIYAYYYMDARGELEFIPYFSEDQIQKALVGKINLVDLIDHQDHQALAIRLDQIRKELDIEHIVWSVGDYLCHKHIGDAGSPYCLDAVFYKHRFQSHVALVQDSSSIETVPGLIKDAGNQYYELFYRNEFPEPLGEYLSGIPRTTLIEWPKYILSNEYFLDRPVSKKGLFVQAVLICDDHGTKWHYCRTEERVRELCLGKTSVAQRHEQEVAQFGQAIKTLNYGYYDCFALIIHDRGKKVHFLTRKTWPPLWTESAYHDIKPDEIHLFNPGIKAKSRDNWALVDFDLQDFKKQWDGSKLILQVYRYEQSGLAKILYTLPDKKTIFLNYCSLTALEETLLQPKFANHSRVN